MSFKKSQLKEIQARLNRLKRLPTVLDGEMGEIAKEIQATARAMAPIDYGGLKRAIKIRRTGTAQSGVRGFVKGKSSFFIYVDPTVPAPKHRGGVVGAYSWMIHEHMGYGGVQQDIMPSQKSVDAGSALGEVAGGKFMDRAFIKHKGKVGNRLSNKCSDFAYSIK